MPAERRDILSHGGARNVTRGACNTPRGKAATSNWAVGRTLHVAVEMVSLGNDFMSHQSILSTSLPLAGPGYAVISGELEASQRPTCIQNTTPARQAVSSDHADLPATASNRQFVRPDVIYTLLFLALEPSRQTPAQAPTGAIASPKPTLTGRLSRQPWSAPSSVSVLSAADPGSWNLLSGSPTGHGCPSRSRFRCTFPLSVRHNRRASWLSPGTYTCLDAGTSSRTRSCFRSCAVSAPPAGAPAEPRFE